MSRRFEEKKMSNEFGTMFCLHEVNVSQTGKKIRRLSDRLGLKGGPPLKPLNSIVL